MEADMKIFREKSIAIKILQQDIAIPAVVQNKADIALRRIEGKSRETVVHMGSGFRKGIWAAAAALVTLGTVACAAAVIHWSSGMEAKLNVTQEQKAFLEKQGITTSVGKSVSREGVTITAQQSIVDARFAQ